MAVSGLAKTTITSTPGLVAGPNAAKIPGALKQAINAVIQRNDIIEHRRARRQYTVASNFTGTPSFITQTDRRLLVIDSAGRVFLDPASPSGQTSYPHTSTWVQLGTITTLPSAGYCPSAEMNKVAYIATGTRAVKIDGTGTSSLYNAGIQRCPDLDVSRSGSSGWLAASSIVGYRLVFCVTDGQKQLVIGVPSGRFVYSDASAGNVSITARIPSEILAAPAAVQTTYFYQAYRTPTITVGDPGDEGRLVYQAYLTSTDIAAGVVTFVDIYPDTANKGPYLYTNASQQGIDKANFQPPVAKDIAAFKGAMFYANTTQRHRLVETMLGIPNQYAIQSIQANTPGANQVTYNFAASTVDTTIDSTMYLAATGTTAGSNDGTFAVVSVTGATVVVSRAGGGTAQAGAAGTAMAANLTAGGRTYTAVYSGSTPAPVWTISTAGSVAQQLAKSSNTLVRAIQGDASQTNCLAYYTAGPDDAPGQLLFEEIAIGGAAFTVAAKPTTFSTKWASTLTVARTSTNDATPGRVHFSKFLQPEHCPLTQYFDIGISNIPIRRIIPLRDSLLVFKEDGLFRIYGDGITWGVSRIDDAVRLTQSTAAATLYNKAYAITTVGLLEITDSSVRRISDPVSVFRYFWDDVGSDAAVSVSQSDGLVYINLASNGIGLIYNVMNGTWTQTEPDALLGAYQQGILVAGMAFWLATGSLYVMSEVRTPGLTTNGLGDSLLGTPYPGDRSLISVSVLNNGASSLVISNLNANATIPVGSYLQGNNGYAFGAGHIWQIVSQAGAATLQLIAGGAGNISSDFTITNLVEVFHPTPLTVEYQAFSAGDDSTAKRWVEIAPQLDPLSTATALTVGVYTELNTTEFDQTTPSVVQYSLRTSIDADHRRASRLSAIVKHSHALEYVLLRGIAYQFVPDEIGREQ